MSELELKLAVPPAALGSLRQALQQRGAFPVRMQARYFDTADGALGAGHVALRLRNEGGRTVQTLKAEGDSPLHRLEHEVELFDATADAEPALLLQRHAGSDAAAALGRALAGRDPAGLQERFRTDFTRLRCSLRFDDGGLFELALDEGVARAGAHEAPIAELEIEHLAGPVDGMFTLAEAWIAHGGLWLSVIPKSTRGERLWRGAPAGVAPGRTAAAPAGTARPGTGLDGARLLRQVLGPPLTQVLVAGSEIAEGRGDAECVHQLRIGLRRLRTVLRELQALSPRLAGDWEGGLRPVFSAAGRLRDDEAVAQAVQALLEAAGAPCSRWTPGTDGMDGMDGTTGDIANAAELATMVRASSFQQTLVRLLGLLHADPAQLSAPDAARTRRLVRRRLTRLHRMLRAEAAGFETLPPERQHRLRKRLKRLRYLAELVGGGWKARPVQAFLAALKPAQEALGHHNDLAIAAAAFRREATREPRAWFAVGYLQSQRALTAAAAARALAVACQARPFWRD